MLKIVLTSIIFLFYSPAWAKTAPWVGSTLEGLPCNGGSQGFGPFDYTQRSALDPYKLNIVEGEHFKPEVEALIQENQSRPLESNLNYTLRAWPNHHRALLSIIKYQLDIKRKLRKGKLKTPPECYLQRAIYFSPQDVGSYALYGYYLRKMGRLKEAIEYYDKALEIEPTHAKNAYSYSLLLIDLKHYDQAVKYAKIAYEYGTPPPGLKNKLIALKVWNSQ